MTRRAPLSRSLLPAIGLLLAALPACVNSGSEVGPKLPKPAENTLAAAVVDPIGRPLSNARVTVEGRTTLTDDRGRFRLEQLTGGQRLVRIDARRTTTSTLPAGIFDELAVSISFGTGRAVADRPIVLPDFEPGVSAEISVNQGAALAGTLVDPATGAELVLDGAVATHPQPGAVAATLRFVSVPPGSIPAALEPGGVPRAGALYFAIAPADLVFTAAPTIRIADAVFGIADAVAATKPVTPELDVLDRVTGRWVLGGPAAIGGGLLSSSAIAGGGLHALSVELPPSRTTIVSARVIDRLDDPLDEAAVLSRDGRAARTGKFGFGEIPDVCAADANDVAIQVPLMVAAPAYAAQHALRRDALPGTPGAGAETPFADRPLATTPAGRVRVLAIFQGKPLADVLIGVSSVFAGIYDASELSAAGEVGAEFWDVPKGQYFATGLALLPNGNVIRTQRLKIVTKPGSTSDIVIFPSATKLSGVDHLGRLSVFARRGASSTSLFNTYLQVGLDPNTKQKGIAPFGNARISPVLKGPALLTAGRAYEVSGRGSGVDLLRRTAYASDSSASHIRRLGPSPDIDPAPRGFPGGATLAGAATGLTSRIAAPPVSGSYAVEVRARAALSFEQRLAVALGAERVPREEIVSLPLAPTFAAPAYEAIVPRGKTAIALVERDAAGPLGPITRFGFSAAVPTPFGSQGSLDLTVDSTTPDLLVGTFAGFGGDPAPVRASLVVGTADGEGVDLGDQGAFSFVRATGVFTVQAPALASLRVAAILAQAGTAANGSAFDVRGAVLSDVAEAGVLLAAPVVAAAAPPPGEAIALSPVATGIAWAGDPATDETVLRVTRRGVSLEPSGNVVDADFEWVVRLPGAPSSFRFPAFPTSIGTKAVAPFFQSGQTYTLEIEVRRTTTYDEKTAATSPKIATPSFFGVRSVSRSRVDFRVP